MDRRGSLSLRDGGHVVIGADGKDGKLSFAVESEKEREKEVLAKAQIT